MPGEVDGTGASAAGGARCPVLVGFTAERTFLERAFERTTDGGGGLVTVLGPAGIGKS